jgi:outer membrane protein
MQMQRPRSFVMLGFFSLMAYLTPVGAVQAENWEWTPGGTEPRQWMFGFRAGFAPLTQSLTTNSSTDVGPLVNVQGMYGLTKWASLGLMVEWERHAVDQRRPHIDLGHQDAVSLLPTVEVRPGRLGPIAPYASMGFGVNVNSFSESSRVSGTTISPSNTFAWRLAWGADYFVTPRLSLNAEMAYKRNDGHATINGVQNDDWNASSFGVLFGLRASF